VNQPARRGTARPPRRDAARASVPDSLRYYESQAETYAARYHERSASGQALRERRRLVLELLDGARGEVLDVGCGPAVMAAELVAAGWGFYGIDASAGMVREGAHVCRSLGDAHVAVGSLPRLPFSDHRFDAVVCVGVIDRLPDPEETLAELGRVLKPEGTFLVSFPNASSPWARWRTAIFLPAVRIAKRIARKVGRRESVPDLTTSPPLWSPRRAAAAVDRHVGRVDRIAHFHYNVLLSPLDEVFPRAATRLAARMERLRNGRLRWLGIGFIVRATKGPSPASSGDPG
jgi:ubiquinone/menaquinone biosynthesis C-methylase UbiE